jgi:single-strand DNA-binding protein
MNGIAKAIILGTSGSDAVMAYTAKGTPVINLSLAVNRKGSEGAKQTSWFKVVVFGKYAETLQPMIKKGTQLYVEGELNTRIWEDKSGNKRETTEIQAINIQLLGSKETLPPYNEEF